MLRNHRGAVLGVAILTALVSSVAAYIILMLALTQARLARFHRERIRARYAAEAGVIWAQQQLWTTPGYCGNPPPPSLNGLTVTVSVTNCEAGLDHTVKAQVTY